MDGYKEMLEDYDLIELETEENAVERFFLIDSLMLRETNYFLVVKADENIDYNQEVDSFILKSQVEDEEFLNMEIVEDDVEFQEISKVFEEQNKE